MNLKVTPTYLSLFAISVFSGLATYEVFRSEGKTAAKTPNKSQVPLGQAHRQGNSQSHQSHQSHQNNLRAAQPLPQMNPALQQVAVARPEPVATVESASSRHEVAQASEQKYLTPEEVERAIAMPESLVQRVKMPRSISMQSVPEASVQTKQSAPVMADDRVTPKTVQLAANRNLPQLKAASVQVAESQESSSALDAVMMAKASASPAEALPVLPNSAISIMVLGAVHRPGPHLLVPPVSSVPMKRSGKNDIVPLGLTLTRALYQAGGVTAQANIRTIEVHRSLPSGETQMMRVDLGPLLKAGAVQDVTLQHGDQVLVFAAPAATVSLSSDSTPEEINDRSQVQTLARSNMKSLETTSVQSLPTGNELQKVLQVSTLDR